MPTPERRRRAGDGRRGRARGWPRRRWWAGCAARCARTRSRATPRRAWWSGSTGSSGPSGGEPDGHAGLRGVDPRREQLRWVNAGHPPPLRGGADGQPRLTSRAAARCRWACCRSPTFEEVVASTLEPGATLRALHRRPRGAAGEHIDDGLERLAQAVASAPAGARGALRPRARARWCPDGGASDDVALLALQQHADGRTASAWSCRPSPRRSPRCAQLLRRWLRHAGGSEQEIAEITTACGEAATNAIEHAGAGRRAVRDRAGTPRRRRGGDRRARLRRMAASRARATSGRGLSLMRALMDYG